MALYSEKRKLDNNSHWEKNGENGRKAPIFFPLQKVHKNLAVLMIK
jgi:hypothetical protein